MSASYKIVRMFMARDNQVVKRGLTLEQAQAHCGDPETSSSTCQSPNAVSRTEMHGAWFDGYEKE